MKMKSMKMGKAERGGMTPTAGVAGDYQGPEYPYGLRLSLDSASLKKLGVSGMPKAGAECEIHAKGKVIRVSQSVDEKRSDKSMEIQITRMAMDHEAMDRKTLRDLNLDINDPKVRQVYEKERHR